MTGRSSVATLLAEARAADREIDAVLAGAGAGGDLVPVQPSASPPLAPTESGREVFVMAKPGESADEALARAGTSPFLPGAATVRDFMAKGALAGALASAGAVVQQLEQQAEDANAGELAHAEAMLAVQATSLDAIFNTLARKAAAHVDKHPDATERFLRMALKAQAQCRATVETLAAIKNGPIVFARQANINNGGQQQVNNGGAAGAPGPVPRVRTRGKGKSSQPNELQESGHGERLEP